MNKPPDIPDSPLAQRGRRTGSPDTRGAILRAARRRFPAQGYGGVSLRSIAEEAGVDVALISYFFGSKRGLFAAAMALEANPAEELRQILRGDLISLPQRSLGRLLHVWDEGSPVEPLRVLFTQAFTDPAVTTLLKEMIEREIVIPLAQRLGGGHADRRAAAFASQILGIIWSRYLLRLEPLASMAPDELLRHHVPALRAALHEGPAARAAQRP